MNDDQASDDRVDKTGPVGEGGTSGDRSADGEHSSAGTSSANRDNVKRGTRRRAKKTRGVQKARVDEDHGDDTRGEEPATDGSGEAEGSADGTRKRIEISEAALAALTIEARARLEENLLQDRYTQMELFRIQRSIAEALSEIMSGPGRPAENSGKFSGIKGIEMDDVLGAPFNETGRTVRKRRAVGEAAEKEPERFAKFAEEMDRSGKVDGAYKKVCSERRKDEAKEENEDQEILNKLEIKIQPYDVWMFHNCDDRFGSKYPGRVPGQLVVHCLYFWTKQGDIVLDPMAGSGTTIDVCNVLKRKILAFDAKPSRPDVKEHDFLRSGWPEETEKAAFIFWDPPYYKKVDEGYSDQSISRLSKREYLDFFGKAVSEIPKGFKGKLALLVSDYNDDENEEENIWYWDYVNIFLGAGNWKVVRRIQVPLTSQSVHPDIVLKFRDSRKLARLGRDLVVFDVK